MTCPPRPLYEDMLATKLCPVLKDNYVESALADLYHPNPFCWGYWPKGEEGYSALLLLLLFISRTLWTSKTKPAAVGFLVSALSPLSWTRRTRNHPTTLTPPPIGRLHPPERCERRQTLADLRTRQASRQASIRLMGGWSAIAQVPSLHVPGVKRFICHNGTLATSGMTSTSTARTSIAGGRSPWSLSRPVILDSQLATARTMVVLRTVDVLNIPGGGGIGVPPSTGTTPGSATDAGTQRRLHPS
jgi:hypothetical protein